MALEDLVDDVMNDREERSDHEDLCFGDFDDPAVDCLHTADQRVYTRLSSPDERVYMPPPSHADQLMTMMQRTAASSTSKSTRWTTTPTICIYT